MVHIPPEEVEEVEETPPVTPPAETPPPTPPPETPPETPPTTPPPETPPATPPAPPVSGTPPAGASEEEQIDHFVAVSQQQPGKRVSATITRADGSQRFIEYLDGKMVRQTQLGEGVTAENGQLKQGDLENQALSERLNLPTTGEPIDIQEGFFDNSRGVFVHAPAGKAFQLFAGGGVKIIDSPGASLKTDGKAAGATSLFGQATQGGKPVEGFKQEQLGITPATGKKILRTGQTIKNPQTGVDVHAKPGHILIEYEDGTVEERPVNQINEPGEPTPIGEFGPTAEELGIDRTTEIKGGAGTEVTRAPITETVAQIQARGGSPEEIEARIDAEGLAPTSALEFIGNSYQPLDDNGQPIGERRTASPGMAFFQDVNSREILERPASQEGFAQPSTSPSILAERAAQEDAVNGFLDSELGFPGGIGQIKANPIGSAEDLYNSILDKMGVGEIQDEIKSVQEELEKLDKKHAEEVAKVDENPWLSQSLRDRKQDALTTKFNKSRELLVNRLQLANSLNDSAREDARFLTTSTIQQYNTAVEQQMNQLKLAYDRQDAAFAQRVSLKQLGLQEQQLALQQQGQAFDQGLALQQFGLSASKEARIGGGGGGGAAISGIEGASNLTKAVLANPALYKTFSQNDREQVAIELQQAGRSDILTALTLPNVSGENRFKLSSLEDVTRNVDNALAQLDAGLNLGPIATRFQQAKEKVGKGDPRFTAYNAAISLVSANILRALSGVAVNPQEYDRIKAQIPIASDQESTARRKMERLRGELNLARDNFLSRQTQTSFELRSNISSPSDSLLNELGIF